MLKQGKEGSSKNKFGVNLPSALKIFLAKEVPIKTSIIRYLLLAMTTKNDSFVSASMRLFNSVVRPEIPLENDTGIFLKEYGLIISPSATHYKKEILNYLKKNKVSGSQMNQTFYSSQEEVENKSFESRLTDQLTHYFSTYGLNMLGINTDFMYIPHNWENLNLPEKVKFELVTGVSANILISACLDLLVSGIAMKQETIEDILTVLECCGYNFTGNELIKNKEARMFVYDKKSLLPFDSEDLFRFIIFKATGNTTLVKDKKTFDAIKTSGYALPNLTEEQLKNLATSFNRRKEYWLSIKSSNDLNRPIVNKISRYSKNFHEPLKQDILNTITSSEINIEKLKESLNNTSVFRIVRAINALTIQSLSPQYSLYNIRNGKIYVKDNKDFKKSKSTTDSLNVYKILVEHLKSRINNDKKVYIPTGLQYSFPTSEKQFVGEVPNFSTIDIDYSKRDLLVGVYWKNDNSSHVDYDLSCNSLDGNRVGWNSRWSDGDLVYSGDITNAPNGAAEWMVVKNLTSSWEILNNLYFNYGDKSIPEFTIMVGYGKNKKSSNYQNYFINPDDLLFSAKVKPVKRQTVIGVVSPSGDNIARFTLLNSGNGSKTVASTGQKVSLISATLPRAESTLKLNDFLNICNDPSEADIDLSPSKLSKDSLLSLIK